MKGICILFNILNELYSFIKVLSGQTVDASLFLRVICKAALVTSARFGFRQTTFYL